MNPAASLQKTSNVSGRISSHRSYLRRKIHSNSELQNDFILFGEKCFRFERLSIGNGLNRDERRLLEKKIL